MQSTIELNFSFTFLYFNGNAPLLTKETIIYKACQKVWPYLPSVPLSDIEPLATPKPEPIACPNCGAR
jgi:hypothetical protein